MAYNARSPGALAPPPSRKPALPGHDLPPEDWSKWNVTWRMNWASLLPVGPPTPLRRSELLYPSSVNYGHELR